MSVSILAIAALVVGAFFNRSRQPAPTPEISLDNRVENAVQLEALRRAGF